MLLLDDAALNRVYVDLVRPLLFEDLSASAVPELIMVGGQPSAGRPSADTRGSELDVRTRLVAAGHQARANDSGCRYLTLAGTLGGCLLDLET